MFLEEEVTNEEGREYSKVIDAIYKRTSAKYQNGGIDDLFKNIGLKFLHQENETDKSNEKQLNKTIKRIKRIDENKRKKCC